MTDAGGSTASFYANDGNAATPLARYIRTAGYVTQMEIGFMPMLEAI